MIQANNNTTCRRSCCRGTASRPASHWEPRRLPTWPRKSREERGPRSPGSRKLYKDDIKDDILLVRFWVGWPGLSFRWPPRGTFLPGQSPQTAATEKKTNRDQFTNFLFIIEVCLQNSFYQQLRSAKRCQLDRSKSSCLQKVLLWMENDLLLWFWCYW